MKYEYEYSNDDYDMTLNMKYDYEYSNDEFKIFLDLMMYDLVNSYDGSK